MAQQENLSDFVDRLSDTEGAEELQARLKAFKIEEDLSDLAAEAVPERFRSLVKEFLAKPAAEMSIEQINALTCPAKELSGVITGNGEHEGDNPGNAVVNGPPPIPAEDLDPVAKKYELRIAEDRLSVQFVLPRGISYLEALREIEERCNGRDDRESPAVQDKTLSWFDERQEAVLRAMVDTPCELIGLVNGSLGLSPSEQKVLVERQGQSLATPEQVALAAALYYLQTGENLLQDKWVNTTVPGIALANLLHVGIRISRPDKPDEGNKLVGCSAVEEN